jgi:uncharacterized protein
VSRHWSSTQPSQRAASSVWSGPLRATTIAVSMLLGLAACAEPATPPTHIGIATGSPTGVYYVFGQAFAAIINRELPNVRAEVLKTSASAENVQLVGSGAAQLGFTQADILPPADNKVLAVARVYDDLLHLVSRTDGPIRKLDDLAGRRLSIGALASGTAITANRLLDVAGLGRGQINTVQLNLDDSTEALRKGEIDAFFFSGGPPVKAVEQLAAAIPIRLVDLGAWTAPLRDRHSQVYVGRDIPTSVYQLEPISTVANPNYLVVGPDVPESLVYDLTRLLMQYRDELGVAHPAAGRMSPQSAIATTPLPLHPGAARFYQSTKP